MPITWKGVVAPNFGASNLIGSGAVKGIGDALDKINIFKNIQTDRAAAADTARAEEDRALTNARIKQQMGLATAAEGRTVSEFGQTQLQDKNKAAITKLLFEAGPDANINQIIQKYAADPANKVTGDFLTSAFDIADIATKPTTAEAAAAKTAAADTLARSKITAAALKHVNEKEIEQIKLDKAPLDLSDITPDIKGRKGVWEWDATSQARFKSVVGSFEGKIPNKQLKALAKSFREDDGDWDEDSFSAAARELAGEVKAADLGLTIDNTGAFTGDTIPGTSNINFR